MDHVPRKLALATFPKRDEEDVEHLKSLVDLAYANRDLNFAEYLVDQLYAYYDRQGCAGGCAGSS